MAPRHPTLRRHHGDEFHDPYEWMREKDSPEVIEHLRAENAYATSQTAHLEDLRSRIFDEILSHTRQSDLSVPVREGAWWYYARTVQGLQYRIHARVPAGGPDEWAPPELPDDGGALPGEQVVFDGNAEAAGHDFFSLGSFDTSADGTLLLYGVDTVGDERFTLRIRDLFCGADLPDEIPGTAHGAVFAPDGRSVFYTTVDDAWRPDTVWQHVVGSAAAADRRVFSEPDERFWVGVELTRSRRYLVISSDSKVTSERLLLEADGLDAEPRPVWPRRQGVEYEVEHAVIGGEDRLLIMHNDGAENFALVDVPARDPNAEPKVVLPGRADVRYESVQAFSDRVVVEYRRGALTRIAIAQITESELGEPRELSFDEELYTVSAAGNPEWEQPTLRLGYGSLVTPASIYDYRPGAGTLTLLKRQIVQGGYDSGLYAQRREWADAGDGERVPISLVYRRDLVSPGTPAPLVLYGYGAYEASIDPAFSIPRLSLLDRGAVFAIAHVRGGGELGRHWYDSGRGLDKANTFTDFVACARHLVDSGWCTSDRLAAEGGSAGGLTMGAVANLAPELFAGILADVPFVDPLTSILDPSLPLTVTEWDEWGDPLHDPEVYAYMKSYSPYENVRDGVRYPRILAVTSLHDTRVLYVEPAKWVARLREAGAPALLKIELSAGHGGVSGRYNAWRERAWELAWLLDVLGLAQR